MAEIEMSLWNSYSPQEKYTLFKQGFRYTNVLGTVVIDFSYSKTLNIPPGFSSSRPGGTEDYTFTGYGTSTKSLDEAWAIYVKQFAVPDERQDPPINELSDMVDDMFKVEIDLPLIGKIKQWYILAGVVGVVIVYFFVVKKR